jgi:thiol:disulfide interchange protein DsbD
LFVFLGIYLVLPGKSAAADKIEWHSYDKSLIQSAKETGTPVIIDFYADWCIPCKELDAYTFSDARVADQSESFIMLKADLTRFQSEEVTQLRSDYNIKGVPTIVFLDGTGNEKEEVRLVGYEDPESFLKRMEKTLE